MIKRALDQLVLMKRRAKQVIMFGADFSLISFSYFAALILANQSIQVGWTLISLSHYLLTTLTTIILLRALGFYHTVTRYVSFKLLVMVSLGAVLSGSTFFIIGVLKGLAYTSFSTSIIYSSMLCISLGGIRLLVRSYFSMRLNTQKEKVLIYGAGTAGRQLALSLLSGHEYYPVGFIDDDEGLEGIYIQGIKVHSGNKLKETVSALKPEKVLLALPSINRRQRKQIINRIEEVGIGVQTIPGVADLVEGRMRIDEFQDVEIDDLLGRDPVPPQQGLLEQNINDKVVLVTGAGGSIGSELCRQIIRLKPRKLLLLDLSEYSLYEIDKELSQIAHVEDLSVKIYPILGSVQNKKHMTRILSHYGVQSLYHAAAYKHVPMVEYNVVEGVKNNIFGTLNSAKAAVESNVETFVLISTDKAVRPTNVMGATKRFAELILQAMAIEQSNTRFCMVRFGNVLGSSGSVIPLFKNQIRGGGPVTVTHPDIIRYFMTIPEAAQLVIQAGAMGKGGDVFVLDMGEPVKIADLAKKLIILMGLEVKDEKHPDGDIEVVYSGLRPGEKLYEELLIGENVEGTIHPLIMTAREKFLEWPEIKEYIDGLKVACENFDHESIRKLMLKAPTDFNPRHDASDLLAINGSHNQSEKNVVKLNL